MTLGTPKRTREEILQDVVRVAPISLLNIITLITCDIVHQMLKVRRSLTEILLEVTNEEIGSICREVWSRARAKGTPDTHDTTNKLIFHTFAHQCTESDSHESRAVLR